VDVSAIVLAGGRSSRFGQDKLAVFVDGTSVLDRTIEAAWTVAGEVVVVVGVEGRVDLPPSIRVATDPDPDGGPLVGVVAGLEAAENPIVLIVGGDMPWLVAGVLETLLAGLETGSEVAALEVDGRAQQLPIAVRREPALAAARALTSAGGRRLGALVEVLETVLVPEAAWRAIDPEAATLRDIDVPDDLPG